MGSVRFATLPPPRHPPVTPPSPLRPKSKSVTSEDALTRRDVLVLKRILDEAERDAHGNGNAPLTLVQVVRAHERVVHLLRQEQGNAAANLSFNSNSSIGQTDYFRFLTKLSLDPEPSWRKKVAKAEARLEAKLLAIEWARLRLMRKMWQRWSIGLVVEDMVAKGTLTRSQAQHRMVSDGRWQAPPLPDAVPEDLERMETASNADSEYFLSKNSMIVIDDWMDDGRASTTNDNLGLRREDLDVSVGTSSSLATNPNDDRLLLGQTLAQWHLFMLNRRLDRSKKLQLWMKAAFYWEKRQLRQCFGRWKDRVHDDTTGVEQLRLWRVWKRWHLLSLGLKLRRKVEDAQNERLLAESLQVWSEATTRLQSIGHGSTWPGARTDRLSLSQRGHAAFAVAQHLRVSMAFKLWKHLASLSGRLQLHRRNTLAVAAQKWQQVLVAKRSAKAAQHYLANIHTIRLFQAWRRQTELRLLQGRAKDSLDARAKCAVWAAWNDRLRDTVRTQQTRAISRNALQKQSFVTWRLVVQARQTLRQRLERLARATFGRWVKHVQKRKRMRFVVQRLSKLLVFSPQDAFNAWKAQLVHKQHLDLLVGDYVAKRRRVHDTATVAKIFHAWQERAALLHEAEIQAIVYNFVQVMSRTMVHWRHRLRQHNFQSFLAHEHARTHAVTVIWKGWRVRFAAAQQMFEAADAFRRKSSLGKTLALWQHRSFDARQVKLRALWRRLSARLLSRTRLINVQLDRQTRAHVLATITSVLLARHSDQEDFSEPCTFEQARLDVLAESYSRRRLARAVFAFVKK